MSSILKALKKLEDERLSPGKERPWLREIQGKVPVSDRLMGGWITHQRFFAVCTAALLGFAGAAIIILKADIFEKPAVQVHPKKQQAATPAVKTLSDHKTQAKKAMPMAAGVLSTVQLPTQKEAWLKTQKVIPKRFSLATPAPEIAVSPVQQPVSASFLPKTSTSISNALTERNAQAAAATDAGRIIEKTAPERTTAVQVLNNEMIRLQAISWSHDPANRIAVINNRIVRQGDRIESYIVAEINKDDVILEQGPEMWQIQFRPR